MISRSALLQKYPRLIWLGPALFVCVAFLVEYFLGPHYIFLVVFLVSGIVIGILSNLIIKGAESTTQLNEVLESMNESFFSIDRDWRLTRVNKPYEVMGNVRREDRIGKSFRDVLIEKGLQNSRYWNEYHKVMQERVPVRFEDYYRTMDMWTECRAYPTSNGGMAVFFSDISDRVRLRQATERAKNEAEHANALKSAFLANMSHEIRTPLGAMIGFADLLRDPSISREEHDKYVEILLRNGQQLSFIIDDVLDLSKIEAGHLTLEIARARPETIASDVVSLLSMKATDKGIRLELHVDPSAPSSVVTDAVRVRQVLTNLVGNAIKFTPAGSVQVKVLSGRTASGRKAFCFHVEDTGIGIPPGDVERIFGEFVQADGSITRKFGGTGLGLALSRKLSRALGGDISILRTETGRGTTFGACFEDFPDDIVSTRIERETGPAQASSRSVRGSRILVVDDSPDNQQIIRHFLKNSGAEIETVDGGAQAHEKVRNERFDLVLMDLQMPEMDGYTATRKLRESGFSGPIVALSAHTMDEVRDQCREAGCTDYLPKPINQQNLLATIGRLLGHE